MLQDESEVTSELARGGTPAAPAFTLERLDGEGDLAIESLRGKTIVLNFWASWCGPCRDEMPLLQAGCGALARDRNVVFVGVDVKDFRRDARAFLERYGVTYPNVYDGKGSTSVATASRAIRRRTSSTRRARSAGGSPVRSRRLPSSTKASSAR